MPSPEVPTQQVFKRVTIATLYYNLLNVQICIELSFKAAMYATIIKFVESRLRLLWAAFPQGGLSQHHFCDVSWVVSTPRSPVPVSLHLLALQLKSSLSGLRAPEHPLFTPSLLVLIEGAQGIGV